MRLITPYYTRYNDTCPDRANCSMMYNEVADLSSSHISSAKSQIGVQGIAQYVEAYLKIYTKFGKNEIGRASCRERV